MINTDFPLGPARIRASEHQRNKVLGQRRRGGELTPLGASINTALPDTSSSAPEPSLSIRVSEYTRCVSQKSHATAQQGAPSVPGHTNNSKDSRLGRPPLTPGGARQRISGPSSNPEAELNRSSSLGCHSTVIPTSHNTKFRVMKWPASRGGSSEHFQMRTPISITQSQGPRQARLNTLVYSNSIQNEAQVGSNQVVHERPTATDAVVPVWQEPIVPGSFAERNNPRGMKRPKVRHTNCISSDIYLLCNRKGDENYPVHSPRDFLLYSFPRLHHPVGRVSYKPQPSYQPNLPWM